MSSKIVLGSSIGVIEEYFNVKSVVSKDWKPPIIASPGDLSLIITQINPEEVMLSCFGMTPTWARQPMNIFLARAEGDKNPGNDPGFRGAKAIFMKPAFQKPLFSQRCIVIADAYIEWSGSNQNTPYLVFLNHQERPFGMAGLYDIWKDIRTGEYIHSYCIITVPANSLLRKINASRMPVVLPRSKEMRWLKATNTLAEALDMLTIYPSNLMNAYPISREVDQSGPFDKEILVAKGPRLHVESDQVFISSKNHHHRKKSDVSHWLGNKPI